MARPRLAHRTRHAGVTRPPRRAMEGHLAPSRIRPTEVDHLVATVALSWAARSCDVSRDGPPTSRASSLRPSAMVVHTGAAACAAVGSRPWRPAEGSPRSATAIERPPNRSAEPASARGRQDCEGVGKALVGARSGFPRSDRRIFTPKSQTAPRRRSPPSARQRRALQPCASARVGRRALRAGHRCI